MKRILFLLAMIAVLASPALAQNEFLNPSFELTQNDSSGGRMNVNNLTIPLNWFTGSGYGLTADLCNWDNSFGFVNTTEAFVGSNSLEAVTGTLEPCNSIGMRVGNLSNLNFPITITFYEKNLTESESLIIDLFNDIDANYRLNTLNSNCAGGSPAFDSCATESAGNGWTKYTLIINTNPNAALDLDFTFENVANTPVLLDNFNIAETPSTPTTPLITGAAAAVVGVTPLLVAVGLMLFGLAFIGFGAMAFTDDPKKAMSLFAVGIVALAVGIALVGVYNEAVNSALSVTG